MLKPIRFFVVIFISTTLIGCFSNSPKKQVVIIDKSTGWENIDPVHSSENSQIKKNVAKKPIKRAIKKMVKKTVKKTVVRKNKSLPVTGKIIQHFSKKHPGIVISTHPNQAVRAIRKGVVVYSGDKMKSHGKMIIIKHSLGFYSSYTRNQTLKVHSGDKIKKGQIIALTSKDNFYFEMKKFETPVDPLKYLK
ncbi:MAG: hypothetical protein Ctma_0396 [Catillopecten margaritatus gill symbiont]|uniref:M23ase beta-sheet core domain-containing protein n=1 Tax=Catillopecten margaritatus gill symbiont TaxID=3083288 RepID=A0AAU6PFB2_9GAMM